MGEDLLGATVTVSGLTKRYRAGSLPVVAVDDLSLRVAAGSIVAVTGASGSGKSTLLHLIGAVERADAGTVTVDGAELTRMRAGQLTAYRRGIGLVFQRYHLLPTLTALDNVIAPVLPRRVGYDKSARARQLLAAVGLAGRESSLPGQLSGGQQQRVAIARALMGRPRLLLADEPTGNLDSKTGADILDLLLALRAEYRMTVLVATHEQHVAARCERLVRLRDGRLTDDVDLLAGQAPDETVQRAAGLRP
jgi:putative ABC transport system ATP-binding protein